MNEITLKCFNCGKERDILVESLPTFSFELIKIANNSGMLGVLDLEKGRALVFCNEKCCANSKTKKGNFKIK